MNDEALVEELQPIEQLDGDALDLGFRERRGHVVEQAGQVLLTILHHQKYAAKTNTSLKILFLMPILYRLVSCRFKHLVLKE